ncbi:dihydroxyacetone kinase phosphoryl donor subunit DhaM [Mycoplasma sp. E35C]|uniref:dihydroxyacetone kinase phosphoryl donor subunit DhaM n=1 Tax=Mycoplasma sp. E35C TaxID=2801918 RepID=UPI001CA3AE09|nr:dihydroxyacetone kinase phosphoryl donor subunit DhaM [Mycoplasma sp. E35C]QZX48867.1 diguanylate cyclase [Mycoplasma sp. E35C]
MVGIVIVSHNYKLGAEIINFVNEMKFAKFEIINASGIDENTFGSDPLKIKQAIQQAWTDEGVLIFADIGSSILNAQMAIEFLDEQFDKSKVIMADAPIVEGALVAVSLNVEQDNVMVKILDELAKLKTLKKV